MNEAEWLACGDVTAMLIFLDGKVSPRQLRLFATACCDRISHLLTDARSRRAVQVAARFADGEVTEAARLAAYCEARQVVEEAERQLRHAPGLNSTALIQAALAACHAVGLYHTTADPGTVASAAAAARRAAMFAPTFGHTPHDPGLSLSVSESERAAQADLLRDLIGPLHPPGSLRPWQTPLVVAIARACYHDRDFRSLTVLADALEDAGCTFPAVLDHCRQQSDHVRGCWVLDRVLDRC